jgi:hypothetical protein
MPKGAIHSMPKEQFVRMKEDKVDFKWIFALNVLGGIGCE